jgi:hypothetical protein
MKGDPDLNELMDHYKRACKHNLKANRKCCRKCPFKHWINMAQSMEKEGWNDRRCAHRQAGR